MALLEIKNLDAYYGDFQALFGVELRLHRGETVAIIGANGAGKSTLMRSIAGQLSNTPDAVRFDGRQIGDAHATEIVRLGIAMVPEGRKLFPSLSVEENLLIGIAGRGDKGPWNLETVFELFPILKEKRRVPGTALSGGQQQMVAVGRALMSNPDVLLCDEISLGLAPVVIGEIYAALEAIRAGGSSIVVVEQDIHRAISVSDRLYCLMEGKVRLEGRPEGLSQDDIHSAYFGANQ